MQTIKRGANSAALAIGALGSLIAGTAQAAIIYQDINLGTPRGNPLVLDVNGDGTTDLSFLYTYSSYSSYSSSSANGDLVAAGLNGTQVSAGGPLAFGSLIDAALVFGDSNHLADYNHYRYYSYYSCGYRGRYTCTSSGGYTNTTGTWNDGFNQITGYLGFAMSVGTDELFGWVDLTMNATGYATINGIGYESFPSTALTAGQMTSNYPLSVQSAATSAVAAPGALGLLALGAVGMAGVRRRRRTV